MSIVRNHDICGLQRRLNRFIIELMKCASTSNSQMTAHDQARLKSYIAAIRGYQAWVVAQPQLDLPETSPREYPLDPDPEVPDIRNESVQDCIVLVQLARDEMVSSQSASQPSGLISFDSARLTNVIDKLESLLDTYIAVVDPLDLPESSPNAPIAEAGRTGV